MARITAVRLSDKMRSSSANCMPCAHSLYPSILVYISSQGQKVNITNAHLARLAPGDYLNDSLMDFVDLMVHALLFGLAWTLTAQAGQGREVTVVHEHDKTRCSNVNKAPSADAGQARHAYSHATYITFIPTSVQLFGRLTSDQSTPTTAAPISHKARGGQTDNQNTAMHAPSAWPKHENGWDCTIEWRIVATYVVRQPSELQSGPVGVGVVGGHGRVVVNGLYLSLLRVWWGQVPGEDAIKVLYTKERLGSCELGRIGSYKSGFGLKSC
ncbi:hypothetical protein PENSPDRAFT_672212 [Peniophora sp. CONT]|nr:hypothetical protein PENSPDRAFT_672212 [Peniophora sp. CONT]